MSETDIIDSCIESQIEILRSKHDRGYSTVDRFRLVISLMDLLRNERDGLSVYRPFYDAMIQRLFEQKEDLEKELIFKD